MARTIPADEELEESYGSMVKSIARKIKRQTRCPADFEELYQSGLVGLVEAQRRFDPEAGAAFSTFAYYRVRGAIMDALRGLTGISRTHARQLRRANEMAELTRSMADTYEGRDTAEDDAAYLEQVVGGLIFVGDLADLQLETRDSEALEHERSSRAYHATPEQVYREKELRERLDEVLDRMDDDEAEVLRQHYLEGQTLSDYAASVGVSRSWMSRIHTRAVRNARGILREMDGGGRAGAGTSP